MYLLIMLTWRVYPFGLTSFWEFYMCLRIEPRERSQVIIASYAQNKMIEHSDRYPIFCDSKTNIERDPGYVLLAFDGGLPLAGHRRIYKRNR